MILLRLYNVGKIILKNFQKMVDIGQKTKYYLSIKTSKVKQMKIKNEKGMLV